MLELWVLNRLRRGAALPVMEGCASIGSGDDSDVVKVGITPHTTGSVSAVAACTPTAPGSRSRSAATRCGAVCDRLEHPMAVRTEQQLDGTSEASRTRNGRRESPALLSRVAS